MPYCANCGGHIPDQAKFCVHCGERIQAPEPEKKPAKHAPVMPVVGPLEASDPTYRLMEPGESFRGYRIVKLMNKDAGGIKYIAEKDGIQYVLKLYFKSLVAGLSSTVVLLNHLKKLPELESAHIARIAEVNQSHNPPYMAAEFVSGQSLAKIKAKEPERLSEGLIVSIAQQLVSTAVAVHKLGLTLQDLMLSGIMLQPDGNIVVLSSGINCEDVDERLDVFNIGTLIAQMLSRNTLYSTLYSKARLSEQKFAYIPGVSLGLNKVLADCLHRNIIQRYTSLNSLLNGLRSLPPAGTDQVYTVKSKGSDTPAIIDTVEKPEMSKGIEWWFWAALGLIALLLILLLTTNMFSVIFSKKAEPLRLGGVFTPADTSGTPLRSQPQDLSRRAYRESPNSTSLRVRGNNRDPRLLAGSTDDDDYKPAAPAPKRAAPMPASFVRIDGGTFGFNRLKENLNHNVSQSGFYISRYEVTQAEWTKFMMPVEVVSMGDRYPVENISWMNAIRYCNARSEAEGLEKAYTIVGANASQVTCDFSANGYRLPTEAEWEMAAKAGALFNYSGSDDPADVAWFKGNSSNRPRPGGGKQANDFGLYDMTGNVSEWCWDWYDAKYPSTLTTFVNPTGPKSGSYKVIRGGNVSNGEGTALRINTRERGNPARGYQFVGFRLVRKG